MMKKIISLILVVTLLILVSGCASTNRNLKSFSSEMNGGINRTVTVYNQNGQVVKEYKGRIDIEDSEYGNKVLFDLNGKRVVIYNGVVIAEEK